MKHYLFNGGETPDEIKRILLDNDASIEQKTYTKQLTETELVDFREGYVNNNLEMAEHNEELQAAKEAYKAATKPLKADSKVMLKVLKSRHIEVTGTVYGMANFDTGMMEFINEQGDVVETRRLKAEEKQGSLLRAIKTA